MHHLKRSHQPLYRLSPAQNQQAVSMDTSKEWLCGARINLQDRLVWEIDVKALKGTSPQHVIKGQSHHLWPMSYNKAPGEQGCPERRWHFLYAFNNEVTKNRRLSIHWRLICHGLPGQPWPGDGLPGPSLFWPCAPASRLYTRDLFTSLLATLFLFIPVSYTLYIMDCSFSYFKDIQPCS